MDYDLELSKAASEIKKAKAKKVLIQLPDGLKPKALEIVDYLRANTKAEIYIWEGSCFGACDIPNVKGIDLLIQWGHSKFKKM
ncbi:diphthamide synthesis protein [Candidatus Woesearchaeota archaeon]|nr:diphthamide synthesis protein [Candidatus Woesearchaeota archaeon]